MIYFVRCLTTGLVKIGKALRTTNLADRLIDLRTGSPSELRLESVIDGYTAEEAALHRANRAGWRHGEWFDGVEVPTSRYPTTMPERSGSRWALRAPSADPGLVYFVRCDTTGLTKIGWTTTERGVTQRLRAFQTASATPLRLVSVVNGSQADESAWHGRHERVHGEWFRDVVAPPTAHDVEAFVPKGRAAGPRETATCPGCGESFAKLLPRQKRCSMECRSALRTKCACGAVVSRKGYRQCRACFAEAARRVEAVAAATGLSVGYVRNIVGGLRSATTSSAPRSVRRRENEQRVMALYAEASA